MISFNQKMYLLMPLVLAITLPLGQCDTSESMKCYVCTNIEDSDCKDNPTADKFIMDCEEFFSNKSETFKPTKKDFFCRKTIEQGVTFKGEANNERIIRSCGNIREDRSCYRTSDTQVNTQTCECYDPLCNTADTRTSSSSFFKILIPALAAILFNLS